jgi:CRISPR-associated protein Cas1
MEEWRAVLVDTLVLSQVQRGSINWEDFDVDAEEGGVYLRKGASREFIKKFEERLRTENKYVAEQNPISFRDAIDHQVLMLVKSIEESDPGLYKPVIVR